MNKNYYILLCLVGFMLFFAGSNIYDSFGSNFTYFFTREPSNRAMMFMISGVVVAIFGIFGLLRRPHS